MDKIPDGSIDLILCDLPYGRTACKWDFVLPMEKLWKQYERIIKDKHAIILFGQEPFSSAVRMSNPSLYRYDWIWEKQRPSNFQLMNYQCGRIHENIMVFSTGKACYTANGNSMVYYPQKTPRDRVRKANVKIYGDKNILHHHENGKADLFKTYTEKLPTSILSFRIVGKKLHPAQKPVDLLSYLIRTYTNEGEVVLDNCMGSGAKAIVCIQTGRKFLGFEKDPQFFRIAKERIEKIL